MLSLKQKSFGESFERIEVSSATSELSPKKMVRRIRRTVETRIKEPVFIRASRQTLYLLNPLNKNLPEAETGRDYSITCFMCSEFSRTLTL